MPIPQFSGLTGSATGLTATIFVGAWPPNADLYLLWADDNASVGLEGTNHIDNFAVTSVVITNVPLPLTVSLTAPVHGWIGFPPLTVSASTFGDTAATSVFFYTNGCWPRLTPRLPTRWR